MRQQFGFPKGLPGTRDKRKKKKNSRQSGADWGIAAVYSPELVRTAQDNGQGGREGEQAASFRACDVAFGARAAHTELSIYLSIYLSIHPSIYLSIYLHMHVTQVHAHISRWRKASRSGRRVRRRCGGRSGS